MPNSNNRDATLFPNHPLHDLPLKEREDEDRRDESEIEDEDNVLLNSHRMTIQDISLLTGIITMLLLTSFLIKESHNASGPSAFVLFFLHLILEKAIGKSAPLTFVQKATFFLACEEMLRTNGFSNVTQLASAVDDFVTIKPHARR